MRVPYPFGSGRGRRCIGIHSENSETKPIWPHQLECTFYGSLTLRDPLGQFSGTKPIWPHPLECTFYGSLALRDPLGQFSGTKPIWPHPLECTFYGSLTLRDPLGQFSGTKPIWPHQLECTFYGSLTLRDPLGQFSGTKPIWPHQLECTFYGSLTLRDPLGQFLETANVLCQCHFPMNTILETVTNYARVTRKTVNKNGTLTEATAAKGMPTATHTKVWMLQWVTRPSKDVLALPIAGRRTTTAFNPVNAQEPRNMGSQTVGTLFANQHLTTYLPASSPADREPLADERPVQEPYAANRKVGMNNGEAVSKDTVVQFHALRPIVSMVFSGQSAFLVLHDRRLFIGRLHVGISLPRDDWHAGMNSGGKTDQNQFEECSKVLKVVRHASPESAPTVARRMAKILHIGSMSRVQRLRGVLDGRYDFALMLLLFKLTKIASGRWRQVVKSSARGMLFPSEGSDAAMAALQLSCVFGTGQNHTDSKRNSDTTLMLNRIRLERAHQNQSSGTHKTPYDRVKRCRETTVTEWLDCSPTSKANRVQSPAGLLLDFRTRGYCRTKPLVAGFSRDLPFPPPLHSGAAPFSPHFTLIGSRDGGGNGRSPGKPADQRRRPTRFPLVKIRSDPSGYWSRFALVVGGQANRSANVDPCSTMGPGIGVNVSGELVSHGAGNCGSCRCTGLTCICTRNGRGFFLSVGETARDERKVMVHSTFAKLATPNILSATWRDLMESLLLGRGRDADDRDLDPVTLNDLENPNFKESIEVSKHIMLLTTTILDSDDLDHDPSFNSAIFRRLLLLRPPVLLYISGLSRKCNLLLGPPVLLYISGLSRNCNLLLGPPVLLYISGLSRNCNLLLGPPVLLYISGLIRKCNLLLGPLSSCTLVVSAVRVTSCWDRLSSHTLAVSAGSVTSCWDRLSSRTLAVSAGSVASCWDRLSSHTLAVSAGIESNPGRLVNKRLAFRRTCACSAATTTTVYTERGGAVINIRTRSRAGVEWAALNNEVLRAYWEEMRCKWSSSRMQEREKREITEKTRRPAASSST
ncbi:hypothetical protein PR048_016859 [Dryococelus australis]|uniref:Uncharacterized protein n=1 Tax=Dryococelus australis TaxID=614101 RepID=A0ABQ9H847_9NEOP|nr:hypothetical protein PR048_016859 [Dryococelus australis]